MWDGQAAWHFVTLPKQISAEIKKLFGQDRPGWGAVPVEVSVSKFKWQTSIFPDKKAGAYLLPIKSEARKQTGLSAGQTAQIKLKIRQ